MLQGWPLVNVFFRGVVLYFQKGRANMDPLPESVKVKYKSYEILVQMSSISCEMLGKMRNT
jgi:hypothetical protein